MIVGAATRSGRALRRAAVAGLVVALSVLGASAAVPAAASELKDHGHPVWAPAATAEIHPGVRTDSVGAICTANFVFTDGKDVFLGQAAHCSSLLAPTDTEPDGCSAAVRPVGTPVTVEGATHPGTLAYSSWSTMQAVGETDPDACAYNDFALVRIDPDDVDGVNPSLPVYGGPTRVDGDGLPAGERVFGYGNSPQRQGLAPLKPSSGVSVGDVGGGRAHIAYLVPPVIPGESGGPYVDADGAAVGTLIGIQFLPPPPASTVLADLAAALAYGREHGELGKLRLVPGTEPFRRPALP